MILYVYEKASASLPRKENLEQVEELADCPVVIAFPSTFTFGTIYRVTPAVERTQDSMIHILVNDPKKDWLNLEAALRDCVADFMRERHDTISRWRLFINGRAYGPAFPPLKAGGPRIVVEKDIVEHVKYWLDMDAGFYR